LYFNLDEIGVKDKVDKHLKTFPRVAIKLASRFIGEDNEVIGITPLVAHTLHNTTIS